MVILPWRAQDDHPTRAKLFINHARRMNYQALARRDWPIGSRAVEAGCCTRQCRRKRPGQFWTKAGLRYSDVLEEARDNGYWDELWLTA